MAATEGSGVQLPDFDRPPVVEAVIGLEFAALPIGFMGLAAFHDLWSDEYPIAQEAAALAPSQPIGQPAGFFQFQLSNGLPPQRLWSVALDGGHWLVQSQADRLIVNWRQLNSDSEYPHFHEMHSRFMSVLKKLSDHTESSGLGALQPLVAEYTYVNKLPGEFEKPEYVYSIFSEAPVPLAGRAEFTRFQTVRRIERDGLSGQLSISSEPLAPQMTELNLTVSTKVFVPPATRITEIDASLVYAHEASVEAFASVTSPKMHEEWGRNDSH